MKDGENKLTDAAQAVPSESPAPTPQAKPEDTVTLAQYQSLKSEFDKVTAFADRIKADEKAEREKRQNATSQAADLQTELSAQGEMMQALAKHNETLMSALQTVQPIVEARQVEVDTAKVTVSQRMENGLPSYMKAALDGWQDDPMKALSIIQDFDKASAQTSEANPLGGVKPAVSNSTTGTPGNETAQVDFGQLMADGAKLADLQQKFPDQWAKQKQGVAQAAAPNIASDNFLSGMFGGSAGTQKGR